MLSTFCHSFNSGHCRSCTEIEQPLEDQLRSKEARLAQALSFLGPIKWSESVQSPSQEFRNRAKLSVTGSVSSPIVGLLGVGTRPAELDQGRVLLDCPIHHPKLNQLIALLPEWITSAGIEPYQIAQQRGELKGVIAFFSENPRAQMPEMYLRFVLRSRAAIDRIQKNYPKLQQAVPELVCVSVNLQPVAHAILEGEEEIILTPRNEIRYELGEVPLRLSPQAFVQTNSQVAEKLYQTAADWISEIRPRTMLELFCGQGAFSFFARSSADRIVGVEINADAVVRANQTARELGLSHVQFVQGDVQDRQALGRQLVEIAPDLILVNPPRRGLGKSCALILEHAPQWVVYSSCAVSSLASDLQVLQGRYRLRKAQIFDLFPHTQHFETLVLLERNDS